MIPRVKPKKKEKQYDIKIPKTSFYKFTCTYVHGYYTNIYIAWHMYKHKQNPPFIQIIDQLPHIFKKITLNFTITLIQDVKDNYKSNKYAARKSR